MLPPRYAILFLIFALFVGFAYAESDMCTIDGKKPGCVLPDAPTSSPASTATSSSMVPVGARHDLEKFAGIASARKGQQNIEPYPVEKLEGTVRASLQRLKSELPDGGGCRYENSTQTDRVLALLCKTETNPAAVDQIHQLEKTGTLKQAIGRFLRKGSPERCHCHVFDLFTSDGYVLHLHYD